MNAKVTRLYENGWRVPKNKKVKTVEGDLNLSVFPSPMYGSEACVLSDGGTCLIPSIVEAHCVCIAAHGLRLRGVEIVEGREYAQEWWCVPYSRMTE